MKKIDLIINITAIIAGITNFYFPNLISYWLVSFSLGWWLGSIIIDLKKG
jgi:hypothetical protein